MIDIETLINTTLLMDIFVNALIYYLIFNLTYYLLSGVLFLIDYYKIFIEKKIQHKTTIIETYKKTVRCVMQNTLFYIIFPILLFSWYDSLHVTEFSYLRGVLDIFVTYFLTDILFYAIHRIFHTKYLYKRFHKKHHTITAPVGFSALYMTVLDLYFSNFVPVFVPMYVLGAHPITIKVWMIITTVDTILLAHSGFKKLADFHDYHHERFNKNYGTDVFMDRVFKTRY